jgi:hypothetical protein
VEKAADADQHKYLRSSSRIIGIRYSHANQRNNNVATNYLMTRDQAEYLVDVLEERYDALKDEQALFIAAELRELFGMVTRERQKEFEENRKKQKH